MSCLADKCLTILARQPGTPMFSLAVEVRVPSAEFVASGDIDGDGKADLVGSGNSALWMALSAHPAGAQTSVPLGFARAKATGVVLNEIMSSNSSTALPIGDDRFSDWVELYNPTGVNVNLSGWSLEANEGGGISTITFPAGTVIGPMSRKLIICSSAVIPGFVTTGWKLSDQGGGLTLKRPGAIVVDSVQWPAQRVDSSFGRYGDGVLSWTSSNMASPGAANVYTGAVAPTLSFQGFDVDNFTPGTPINLFAVSRDDVAVIGVSLSWRRIDIPGASWQRVLFYDDGRHGDNALGDDLFAGRIPGGLPATAQIEFYLEATDTSGITVYDPAAPSDSEDNGSSPLYTLAFSPEPAPIEISEIVTSNDGWWSDSAGDSPDYVEIHNHSAAAVALAPYALIDSGLTNSERFHFPAGSVLMPGERCMVLCSGTADENWNAAFKLNAGGDTLYLQEATPGGSWLTVEKIVIPGSPGWASAFARAATGAGFSWMPATPGRENVTANGNILSWLRPSAGDGAEIYMVFPTNAGRQWTVQSSDSPAGPWTDAVIGQGTGADSNALLRGGQNAGPVRIPPAAQSRFFLRVLY